MLFKKTILVLIILLGTLANHSMASDAGKTAYQRCSACHLADGAGVPGAFPPLKDRLSLIANDDTGREYLIAVIKSGLSGMLNIGGMQYMGYMPAQGAGLSNEQIAGLLNYLISDLNAATVAEDWKMFSGAEVEKTLNDKPSTSANGNAVLRAELKKKYPQF